MDPTSSQTTALPPTSDPDWEAFYQHFRKPGYVPGYEIVHKLGAGAFGIVFKARKESIGKDFAIKFLKVDDSDTRETILKELRSVDYFAQVDHPHLVAIEDRGEVDGIPYIVMAFAGDETLRDRIDRGDLSLDESLGLFDQITSAVSGLHDRSLVHFDLKPANVYLKGELARVGDYGLARLVTNSRRSLSFGRGTPYYMPPEMLDRRGDHRSDIYSLGIMLYEMLVGEPPFQGETEWEVLRQHETRPVRIPQSVDRHARRVIKRCLQKRPEDRYASVAELRADLRAQRESTQPGPRSSPKPPPRPSAPGGPQTARTASPPPRRRGSSRPPFAPRPAPHNVCWGRLLIVVAIVMLAPMFLPRMLSVVVTPLAELAHVGRALTAPVRSPTSAGTLIVIVVVALGVAAWFRRRR